jgi:hypothetical protein
MTAQSQPRKRSAKEVVPPMLIGALGIIVVIALYALVPDFQSIELVLLVTAVYAAVGYLQGIIRGISTLFILYFATGVAAIFYRVAAPYTGIIKMVISIPITRSFSTDVTIDNGTLAFSFGFLMLLAWIVLEIIARVAFPDTTLPGLGILDNWGGVVVHLIVGILVASLLFNMIGYGRMRPAHNKARLRNVFTSVIRVHYATQSFWFPRNPPPIYIYDLNREH